MVVNSLEWLLQNMASEGSEDQGVHAFMHWLIGELWAWIDVKLQQETVSTYLSWYNQTDLVFDHKRHLILPVEAIEKISEIIIRKKDWSSSSLEMV